MGKHDSYRSQDGPRDKTPRIHPIWRGIGFIFIILIPVISYAGAVVLLEQNRAQQWGLPYPSDLRAKPGEILYTLIPDPEIYIKLILTLVFMFILFSLFAFVTFAVNSAFGASRYGPYDLPPLKRPKGMRRAR